MGGFPSVEEPYPASYSALAEPARAPEKTGEIARIAEKRVALRSQRLLRFFLLFVAQRLDRVQARGLEGGVHPEEDADRGGEAEADRERPPRQRDREARDQVDGPADAGAEGDADQAAERGQERRLHQELEQDLGAAR